MIGGSQRKGPSEPRKRAKKICCRQWECRRPSRPLQVVAHMSESPLLIMRTTTYIGSNEMSSLIFIIIPIWSSRRVLISEMIVLGQKDVCNDLWGSPYHYPLAWGGGGKRHIKIASAKLWESCAAQPGAYFSGNQIVVDAKNKSKVFWRNSKRN